MSEKLSVLLVQPEKVPERIEIDSGLDALQKVVGGYIEAVYPYEDPVALIVNDEGKLNGLPLNRALRDEDGHIYDVIAGPFLVVGLGESDLCPIAASIYDTNEDIVNKILNFKCDGCQFINDKLPLMYQLLLSM